MKKSVVGKVVSAMVGLAMLAGCTGPAVNNGGATEAKSDAARITAPSVPAEDLAELTAGNRAFGMDLYQQLRVEQEGNLFFSPHSISIALAMTYAGAKGQTAEEMADVLNFTLPAEKLHPAFNALDLALQPGEVSEEEQPLVLEGANALWGQKGLPFRPAFLDLLAQNYGAGMRLVDFVNAPEPARLAINQWVSDQTRTKIKDLLKEGTVDGSTRLVLVNAIYFKGGWRYTFNKDATSEVPFTRLDGSQVDVPMMYWSEADHVLYKQGEGYQSVELPYEGGNAVMTIFVPDAGQFEAFESSLTAERLDVLLGEMESQLVMLSMPKFRNESGFELSTVLIEMGMPTAFSGGADFSGMTEGNGLMIGAVIHKAFVEVNETGTEAAAATAVLMTETALQMDDPIPLTIDRPFIYLIRDRQTGEVLFVGRMVDPQ